MNKVIKALGLGAVAAAVTAGGASAAPNAEAAFANGLSEVRQSVAKSAGAYSHVRAGEGGSALLFRSVDENSSWEDIKQAHLVEFPQIGFGSWLLAVDGLCVEGADLRPVKQNFQECVDWARRGDGYECVASRPVVLSTPIHYEREECVRWGGRSGDNWGCLEYARQRGSHKLSFDVAVKSWPPSGDREPRTLFTKRFDIPACR